MRVATLAILLFATSAVAQVREAIDAIQQAHAAHADLPRVLEVDAGVRGAYIRAHLTLAKKSQDPRATADELRMIRTFYETLLSGDSTPATWFRPGTPIPRETRPAIAYLRERALRTYKDVLPATAASRSEYVRVTRMSGARAAILERHNVLLMDNSSFSARQVEVIANVLALIPPELHDAGAIGCVDLIGTRPAEIEWWDFFDGTGGEINIFPNAPGTVQENPFPREVSPSSGDLFLSALVHELNHLVDAFTIQGPANSARNALIAAAGSEHLNYLRSTIPDGFFVTLPQEFFASIANQWFVDTRKTLEVGIARANARRPLPLEQFLFFLDIYSRGTNESVFYASDANGNLVRTPVSLQRDSARRILVIITRETVWRFRRSESGLILSIEIEDLTTPAAPKRGWNHGATIRDRRDDAMNTELERSSRSGNARHRRRRSSSSRHCRATATISVPTLTAAPSAS